MGKDKNNIQLTEADVAKLKSGLDELLLLNKQNEETGVSGEYNSDPLREINSTEDAPRFGEEGMGIFNSANLDKIKKAFNLKRDTDNKEINLNEILERNGIFQYMEFLKENPEHRLTPDKDRFSRTINNLDLYLANNLNKQLLDLIKKNEENYIKINKTNLAENIDLFLKYSKKSIDIIKNSNIQPNLGLGVVSFISITLAYRVLIKSYAQALYGRGDFSSLPEKDRLEAVLNRAKRVRNFSLRAAPLILGGLFFISHKYPSKLTIEFLQQTSDTNQSNIDTSDISKSLLLKKKKKKKKKKINKY